MSLRDRLARAGDGQQAGALSGGAARALGQSADDDVSVQDRRGAGGDTQNAQDRLLDLAGPGGDGAVAFAARGGVHRIGVPRFAEDGHHAGAGAGGLVEPGLPAQCVSGGIKSCSRDGASVVLALLARGHRTLRGGRIRAAVRGLPLRRERLSGLRHVLAGGALAQGGGPVASGPCGESGQRISVLGGDRADGRLGPLHHRVLNKTTDVLVPGLLLLCLWSCGLGRRNVVGPQYRGRSPRPGPLRGARTVQQVHGLRSHRLSGIGAGQVGGLPLLLPRR